MNLLTPPERRALRAKAHHLQPVVTVGQQGLTPAVLHEVDLALLKHELIKVRVFSDARDQRESMLERMCTDMDCAAVQHLGKVLVLWRPNPELEKPAPRPPRAAGTLGAKRPKAKRTGQRTPPDPVRERRRSSQSDGVPAGKGTRGSARFAAPASGDGSGPRGEAPAARRKSTFTPKTKPKSFGAKPNPREAWAKKPPAGSVTPPGGTKRSPAGGGTARRRRKV